MTATTITDTGDTGVTDDTDDRFADGSFTDESQPSARSFPFRVLCCGRI